MSYFCKEKFIERMKRLYINEQGDSKNIFHEVDYFVCVNAKDKNVRINKSTSIMLWLFGLNLQDTIIIHGKSCIYFVSCKKNIQILRTLLDNVTLLAIDSKISLTIKYFETDGDENHKFIFIKVIDIMKSKIKHGKIGCFKNEYCESKFAKIWVKALEGSNLILIDMSLFAAKVMCAKDEQELEYMKKASCFAGQLFSESLTLISLIATKAKNKKKAKCGNSSNNDIKQNQAHTQKKILRNIDVAKRIDISFMKQMFICEKPLDTIKYCFPPLVQSGGFYDLNIYKKSDENYFRDDVIILCLGIRYKQYCSVIIRTIMITPSKNCELKKNFDLLRKTHDFLISNLRNDMKLGKLYQDAVNFVENINPEMTKHLTKNFGAVIGIELEDQHFVIQENSNEVAKENMVFNLNVGLESIYDSNLMERPPHTYCLWIGDCVKVEKDKGAKILKTEYNGEGLIVETRRSINVDI